MNAALPPLHPLLARLVADRGYSLLGLDAVDRFIAAPGEAIVFVTDDPATQKEVLDVAVILPELVRPGPAAPRVALLDPSAARSAAARFGTRRTPALVYYRDGGYLGAIEGLLNWAEFVGQHGAMLAGKVRREPTVGVAVSAVAPGCH
jgi:hydrogenase-1 operon protein HyaE